MRRLLAGLIVLVAGSAARAGDRLDAAARARERVGEVFTSPEFDPLAQADRIVVPEVPASAKSWLRAFVEVIVDALTVVLKAVGKVIGAFVRWIINGFGSLFGGGGGSGGAGLPVWLGWVLGIAAAGLVAFLVWRLVSAARRERAAREAAASLGGPNVVGADDALAKTPEAWRRQAKELAAGGARRDAIRALYLALLSALHRVGAIRYDRTRTNTAYVGDLDRVHPAHTPFASLTRRFDHAWYGAHEPSEAEVGEATAEVDAVLRAYREEAAVA